MDAQLIHDTARIAPSVKNFTTRLKVGAHSRIDEGCILTGDIEIGRYVHLAPYCLLHGKSSIKIGDYSGFSAFTVMYSESDDFTGLSMFGPCVPERKCLRIKGAITIGRGVIGGVKVSILPGVTVGDGATLGAHSLIKGNCAAATMYAGVPAKSFGKKRGDVMTLIAQFEHEQL